MTVSRCSSQEPPRTSANDSGPNYALSFSADETCYPEPSHVDTCSPPLTLRGATTLEAFTTWASDCSQAAQPASLDRAGQVLRSGFAAQTCQSPHRKSDALINPAFSAPQHPSKQTNTTCRQTHVQMDKPKQPIFNSAMPSGHQHRRT